MQSHNYQRECIFSKYALKDGGGNALKDGGGNALKKMGEAFLF